MTGIYLRCDKCGKTLGGEEVTNRWNGLHWSQSEFLRQCAYRLGWTGHLTRESNNDLCPECSKKEAEKLPTSDKAPE